MNGFESEHLLDAIPRDDLRLDEHDAECDTNDCVCHELSCERDVACATARWSDRPWVDVWSLNGCHGSASDDARDDQERCEQAADEDSDERDHRRELERG